MASSLDGTITADTTGKGVGTTTIGATGGTALAGAVAILVVWLLSLTGVEIPVEVHSALVIIIGAIGALVGGYLTPTNKAKVETHVVNAPTDNMTPEVSFDVPDGTGEHRASGSTVVNNFTLPENLA